LTIAPISGRGLTDFARRRGWSAFAACVGVDKDYGGELGVPKTWAFDVIKKVGNFGEVYDRELGSGSPYKLDRGLNRLWNSGGLVYAPVFD
jgi:general L-amino acid transport system substrate-binding protein